ncbi:hypothetical protein [Hyphomicrobium sp. ghe19]|uniref:hypothetical protein n=1 Tax=Hyphomicrobium sp. ghe19 TaxID=2682968 RepID=UPI001366B3FD|nr:hypothetical protein HYPP_02504 [Hyphomicrobium sp. ghe19]
MTLVKSVRQQILEKIEEKFIGIVQTDTSAPGYVPSDDDWPMQFSVVKLGPLSDENLRKRYSLGIVPGTEKYSDLYPYIVSDQMVGLEFRATKNKDDDDPQAMAEQVLTVLKRLVLANTTWDDLAVDTRLVNSEVDLVNYSDRSIVGVLFIEVQYRHARRDPRDPHPNF